MQRTSKYNLDFLGILKPRKHVMLRIVIQLPSQEDNKAQTPRLTASFDEITLDYLIHMKSFEY